MKKLRRRGEKPDEPIFLVDVAAEGEPERSRREIEGKVRLGDELPTKSRAGKYLMGAGRVACGEAACAVKRRAAESQRRKIDAGAGAQKLSAQEPQPEGMAQKDPGGNDGERRGDRRLGERERPGGAEQNQPVGRPEVARLEGAADRVRERPPRERGSGLESDIESESHAVRERLSGYLLARFS